jgi:hypothetical protein
MTNTIQEDIVLLPILSFLGDSKMTMILFLSWYSLKAGDISGVPEAVLSLKTSAIQPAYTRCKHTNWN